MRPAHLNPVPLTLAGAPTLLRGRQQCPTLAVTMSATAVCFLLRHLHRTHRRTAAAVTIQAALRGRQARIARQDVLSITGELNALHMAYPIFGAPYIDFEPGAFALGVVTPRSTMDIWFGDSGYGCRYIGVSGLLV